MQAIRVALIASFLGLFGFARLSANYGAPPSATSDLKKGESAKHANQHIDLADPQSSRRLW
jgi:hypothetical protein